MYYKQILATPAASLRDMSYDRFVEMFKSTNEELELMESAQDRERDKFQFTKRAVTIKLLQMTKDNLTMHRHYQTYCDAQDKRYYDTMYHRSFISAR